MVAERRMPAPVRMDRPMHRDIRALNSAFDELHKSPPPTAIDDDWSNVTP